MEHIKSALEVPLLREVEHAKQYYTEVSISQHGRRQTMGREGSWTPFLQTSGCLLIIALGSQDERHISLALPLRL